MQATAAKLMVHALEQLGVRYTFGIPGVQNTEIYDELDNSETITPILVTHEGGGAFMADAVSRLSDSVGAIVVVPAAGLTHAASGIGEAFLDGIPMLVFCGGVRTDTGRRYQLHQMDQHAFMRALTKGTFLIERHADVIPTIYRAYDLATGGEPGPVFIEIPVNLQLFPGEVPDLPAYQPAPKPELNLSPALAQAAELLTTAKNPGLFVGWGARHALAQLRELAETVEAPVATTLQGLSVFPADHPLHAGFGFGASAVPAAQNAFKNCDCLVAVGTRFAEIATGSYGIEVPANLIHIDINPDVFNANFPAKVALAGDAPRVLDGLLAALRARMNGKPANAALRQGIARDKAAYRQEWYGHDSKDRINPARFFDALRAAAPKDAITVIDDGNHTFLTAELFPVLGAGTVILPTDFNCMGYAVPAAIGAKLARPEARVNAIVGDGAFSMTCMEIRTAATNKLGVVYYVFHDGELSQIGQAQELVYNRKPCVAVRGLDLAGVAQATGAAYVAMHDPARIADAVAEANRLADGDRPVIVDVAIDYAKRSRFTAGTSKTNFRRFPLKQKLRFVGRLIKRKLLG